MVTKGQARKMTQLPAKDERGRDPERDEKKKTGEEVYQEKGEDKGRCN